MSKEINIGYYDNSILEESLKVVELKEKEEYYRINKEKIERSDYWKEKLNEYITFLNKWHHYTSFPKSVSEICKKAGLSSYEGVFFLATEQYSRYKLPITYDIYNNTSDHKAEYAEMLRYDKKYRSR